MRKTLMAAAAAVALIAMPGLASADPNAAANAAGGAAVGAGVGFLVGGPIGAAVGAGVGGTVGAGTAPQVREEVVIERDRRPVRERDCVRDSFGNVSCTEIRR
jgi:hypothetical protein